MSDIVTLDINTYNALKSDSVRANMIVDHLFRTGHFNADDRLFKWDEVHLNEVLEIAYPKRYVNKVAESEAEDGNEH